MTQAAATILRTLACLGLFGAVACTRGDRAVKAPPWSVHVDAALAPTPPPGMSGAVPTELRIYQLRSLGSFESASYDQLYDDDKAALGESLLASHQSRVFLYPQRQWGGDLEIDSKARYLVIVAFLHHAVGRSWSYVAALPPALAAGTMVMPGQLAARPSGFAVRVGPDRVTGRPLFTAVAAPAKRGRPGRSWLPGAPKPPPAPQAPGTPVLPGAPQAPGAPAIPSAPSVPQLPGPPAPPSP